MNQSNASSVFVDAGGGRKLQVLADQIRVLASGADTGGKYEVFELTGPKDSGPPPHLHPWDEAFFIVEGEIDAHIGDQAVHAAAGSFVRVPANTAHSFRITSPSAKFVVLTTEARTSAFFEAMDREIGFPPPSMEAVLKVAERQGIRLA